MIKNLEIRMDFQDRGWCFWAKSYGGTLKAQKSTASARKNPERCRTFNQCLV